MALTYNQKIAILIEDIKKRIARNKNCIIIVNGETGSGKTYAALSFAVDIAKELQTSFSIKDNMDFEFLELLKKMERPEVSKAGTVFLFEEVGAVGGGASSHEWQSKSNRFFNSFMQTSRHKRQIFIMTCPVFTNLDKKTRELCHMQWEMKGINFQNKVSRVRPFKLQVNNTSGKTYMKYLKFKDNGQAYKLKLVEFRLPPSDIVKTYEEAKTKFTTELNKRIIEESKPKEKVATKKDFDLIAMKNLRDQGATVKDIAKIFNVGEATIQRRFKEVKNDKINKNIGQMPKKLGFQPINHEETTILT